MSVELHSVLPEAFSLMAQHVQLSLVAFLEALVFFIVVPEHCERVFHHEGNLTK